MMTFIKIRPSPVLCRYNRDVCAKFCCCTLRHFGDRNKHLCRYLFKLFFIFAVLGISWTGLVTEADYHRLSQILLRWSHLLLILIDNHRVWWRQLTRTTTPTLKSWQLKIYLFLKFIQLHINLLLLWWFTCEKWFSCTGCICTLFTMVCSIWNNISYAGRVETCKHNFTGPVILMLYEKYWHFSSTCHIRTWFSDFHPTSLWTLR